MMNRLAPSILALIVMAGGLCTGCSKKIEGQVFVPTETGVARKLPLAKVYVLTPDQKQTAEAEIDRLRQQLGMGIKEVEAKLQADTAAIHARTFEGLEKRIEVAETNITNYELHVAQLPKGYLTTEPKVDAFTAYSDYLREKERWEYTRGHAPASRYIRAIEQGKSDLELAKLKQTVEISQLQTQAREKISALKKQYSTASVFPESALVAMTDADGAFEIPSPKEGHYVAVVWRFDWSSEHYQWLIPAQGSRMLFSSHNL